MALRITVEASLALGITGLGAYMLSFWFVLLGRPPKQKQRGSLVFSSLKTLDTEVIASVVSLSNVTTHELSYFQ